MADRLTQLQDCLDDMLTQMYASLNYIQTRHPYGVIPGQPQGPNFKLAGDDDDKEEKKSKNNANGNANDDAKQQRDAATPPPETPDNFNAALRELAQDLVLKQQQAEYIINSLPGIGNSEQDQAKRIEELGAELKEMEAEREKKEVEKEALVAVLGEAILKVKRVP